MTSGWQIAENGGCTVSRGSGRARDEEEAQQTAGGWASEGADMGTGEAVRTRNSGSVSERAAAVELYRQKLSSPQLKSLAVSIVILDRSPGFLNGYGNPKSRGGRISVTRSDSAHFTDGGSCEMAQLAVD